MKQYVIVRFRHVTTLILFMFTAASAAAAGILLVQLYSSDDLTELNLSIEVVILVFTASAASLALLKYWGSVEAELEHKQWKKLNYLEQSFHRFRKEHLDIIQAFDWPHILRAEYLPLCEKAIRYDKSDDVDQASIFTEEEFDRIRNLDNFLEFFEKLYVILLRRLVRADDILVLMQYYIILFGDAYNNPKYVRLKEYVDAYYYNIKPLLKDIAVYLCKSAPHRIDGRFAYYPKSMKTAEE